jgi:squalene-hopene/tetraprenyl-beta-curcumene cyclase
MTYLLARPALRRFLHDSMPTKYETQLISRLKTHAGAKAGSLQTVETIFAAMFVDDADARAHTFDQLWALQQHDGPFRGGWQWFGQPNLDPWETPAQNTYGSAFAALAIGAAPEQLRASAESQARIKELAQYLQNESQISPMHGRLMTLWASTKLPEVMTPAARQATIDELLRKQRPDGGWSLETLGPWASHPTAPKSLDVKRSDSYATAFTAYVLKVAGGKGASKQTDRALDWLRTHQDHETGAWPAVSLNKVYPAGSMEESFLQDAATAFAVLALIS